jgi:phosphoribosylaminoimidazolecarboxamide formyltransferase/IMP cyclohydrolase
VGGGWLQQQSDSLLPEDIEFTTVSKTQPTPDQARSFSYSHWFPCDRVRAVHAVS